MLIYLFFTENAGDGKDVDDSTPSTRSNSVSGLPQFSPCAVQCVAQSTE